MKNLVVKSLICLFVIAGMSSCKKDDKDKEIIKKTKFGIFTVQSDEQTVIMNDEIKSRTLNDFNELIKAYPGIKTIQIKECGGSLDDETNLKLSAKVHSLGINTHIQDNGMVASGGTDFFLAGVKRSIGKDTRIGVHSWSGEDNTGKEVFATDFPKGHAHHLPYIKYYVSVGFTQQEAEDFYYFTIHAAPAGKMHWMTADEIKKYNLLGDNNGTSTTSFEEIADLATFHGDKTSSIVIVNTQGGPVTSLEDDQVKEFMNITKTTHVLYANVHQEQTKNPSTFKSNDITYDQAKDYDQKSVASLKKVVDYFKAKNKKVYVLGISFGAFMTQELIANNGIDVADGYLIMVGRLNIDEGTWKPFSQGQYTSYEYAADGSYTIKNLGDGQDAEQRNMARLAAGLGHKRYTERLANINSLKKITYVYGNRDEQVGPLSSEEIKFLKDKGATVKLSDLGTHDKAIDTGLSILKQTFNIQ